MAVYSEIIDDEKIIQMIEASKPKNILVVACGGCTNESLAYKNKTYIFVSEENTEIQKEIDKGSAKAFASDNEAKRLLKLLEKKCYNARYELVPIGAEVLCIQKEMESMLLKKIEDLDSVDFVLALCCPAGVVGLKRLIKNATILSVMRPCGQLFYVYSDKQNKRKMNYNESVIIK